MSQRDDDVWMLRELLRNCQNFVCGVTAGPDGWDMCGDIAEAMHKTRYMREERSVPYPVIDPERLEKP